MEKFSFIPNHINVEVELPYQLVDGCTLKKASDQQIQVIETNLQRMESIISSTHTLPYKVAYSFDQISEEETYISTSSLERNKWKYYIVTYEDEGLSLLKLQFASNLCDIVLTLDAFTCDVYEGQYAFAYNPEIAFRFYSETDLLSQHTLREENLSQILKIHERMINIEGKFTEIMQTIRLFNSLRYLYNYHDFKILGLFCVIESILTHKPTSSETGDSLTRQVRTKVPLLLRRVESGFDYGDIFKGHEESEIWKVLYKYRSALAHGATPDFKKELALLSNPMLVQDLLINCIKKMLVQSLIEPQLVKDLKEC